MKKFLVVLIVFFIVMALAVPAFAAGHLNKPEAHRSTGREFGQAVSDSARCNPLNLANHVSGWRIPF